MAARLSNKPMGLGFGFNLALCLSVLCIAFLGIAAARLIVARRHAECAWQQVGALYTERAALCIALAEQAAAHSLLDNPMAHTLLSAASAQRNARTKAEQIVASAKLANVIGRCVLQLTPHAAFAASEAFTAWQNVHIKNTEGISFAEVFYESRRALYKKLAAAAPWRVAVVLLRFPTSL